MIIRRFITLASVVLAAVTAGCSGGGSATGGPSDDLTPPLSQSPGKIYTSRLTGALSGELKYEIRSASRGPITGAAILKLDGTPVRYASGTLSGTETNGRYAFTIAFNSGIGNVQFQGDPEGQGTFTKGTTQGSFTSESTEEETVNVVGTWRGNGSYTLKYPTPQVKQGTMSLTFSDQNGNRVSGGARFVPAEGEALNSPPGKGLIVGNTVVLLDENDKNVTDGNQFQVEVTLLGNGRMQVTFQKEATTGGTPDENVASEGSFVLEYIGY